MIKTHIYPPNAKPLCDELNKARVSINAAAKHAGMPYVTLYHALRMGSVTPVQAAKVLNAIDAIQAARKVGA